MRINKPKPRLFKLQTSNFKSLLSSSAQEEEQDSRGQPHYQCIYNKKLLTTSQRKVNKMGNFQLKLVLLLFTVCAALSTLSTAQDFKCSTQTAARCQALVGYLPPNKTTISEIQSLFTVKNLRSILGANNFPPGTPRNFSVPAQKPIKVPIHCICSNGTGVSDKVPVYTVKKDDGLDFIARTIFGQLLKYQKIVEANNISNPDLIQIGQNLTIPLPCSCDDVDNAKVVHYAHVVEEGSSFELIAQKFGTDRDTLMKLNGIHDDSKLIAGEPLDVPLKACNSSIKADSFDNYLRVANGTYTFTANSCVKCQCDATNNWTLQCEPSQFQPSSPNSRWKTCPSMLCGDSESLSIGNTTTSNNCNRTTCEYAGYNNLSILTTLNSLSTCPSPSNNALRIGSWNLLLISIFLVLFHFHLIQ